MKPFALTMVLLLAISSASSAETLTASVVDLPRPNSGTFSFQQAEARKTEILSNAPTPKLENWKDPYMGFCIHVGKDDSLTVYGHFLNALPEFRKPGADSRSPTSRDSALSYHSGVIRLEFSLLHLPLKDSKAIHEVLKVLFVPSVQLFYARSGEPGSTANRSHPVGSEINRTPAATGPGR